MTIKTNSKDITAQDSLKVISKPKISDVSLFKRQMTKVKFKRDNSDSGSPDNKGRELEDAEATVKAKKDRIKVQRRKYGSQVIVCDSKTGSPY